MGQYYGAIHGVACRPPRRHAPLTKRSCKHNKKQIDAKWLSHHALQRMLLGWSHFSYSAHCQRIGQQHRKMWSHLPDQPQWALLHLSGFLAPLVEQAAETQKTQQQALVMKRFALQLLSLILASRQMHLVQQKQFALAPVS